MTQSRTRTSGNAPLDRRSMATDPSDRHSTSYWSSSALRARSASSGLSSTIQTAGLWPPTEDIVSRVCRGLSGGVSMWVRTREARIAASGSAGANRPGNAVLHVSGRQASGAIAGAGKPEPEDAAVTRLAVHPDGPAVRLDNLAGDHQAEPAPRDPFRLRPAREPIEQRGEERRLDAGTGILDGRLDEAFPDADADDDGPVRGGELDGISQEIRDHLEQSALIARGERRPIGLFYPDGKMMGLRERLELLDAAVDERGDVEGNLIDLLSGPFQARKVEEVVDHGDERPRAPVDMPDVVQQFGGQDATGTPVDELEAHEDRLQRGSEVMGDHRVEVEPPRLGVPLRGDVPERDRGAGRVVAGKDADAGRVDAVADPEVGKGEQRLARARRDALQWKLGQYLRDRPADEVGGARVEDPLDFGVHVREARLRVDGEEGVGSVVEELSHPRFRLLGPLDERFRPDERAYPGPQFLLGEGLQHVVVRPGLEAAHHLVGAALVDGEEEDADFVHPALRTEEPADLDAAPAGHHPVQDHGVGRGPCSESFEHGRPVRERLDGVLAFEDFAGAFAIQRAVIDHEDRAPRERLLCHRAAL